MAGLLERERSHSALPTVPTVRTVPTLQHIGAIPPQGLKYRHEIKYRISEAQAEVLKQLLRPLLRPDSNADASGSYVVRSLYFDTPDDNAYFDKINGVLYRKKYRIRIYNGSAARIVLECKYKHNMMTAKVGAPLTLRQAHQLQHCEYDQLLRGTNSSPLVEMVRDMALANLRPAVIVEYVREAYVYDVFDTRITFDAQVRSGLWNPGLFDVAGVTVKAFDQVVLEVKFNECLPEPLALVLENAALSREAVSKMAQAQAMK
ncbi:MAG: polyphosphate polymerase domain-containing protein [Propionibacteriaceae bacterium]|jgi:hypothetical protein|nr:polyphosphate polymerase domain-containing protein [Propionibacteriaceae bacterium]